MNQVDILIIGDVMLDIYIYGKVNRLSPEAPCAVLCDCQPPEHRLGGAANVATHIAMSSFKVAIAGCIGNDSAGRQVDSLMQRIGIEPLLIHHNDIVTITKTRYLTQANHQLLRVDNDVRYLPSEQECNDLIRHISQELKPSVVVLSDYDKGMLQPAICSEIISFCNHNGIATIVDIKRAPFTKFANAGIVKGNHREVLQMAQSMNISTEDEAAMLRAIRARLNCQSVVMTKGKEGIAAYSCAEGYIHCEGQEITVCDLTGAGDVVTAFLAMLTCKGQYSLKQMLQIANRAAQMKVSQAGTAIITLDSVLHSGKFVADINAIKPLLQGKRVVFTNGCFDILHAGHIALLQKAKELGDVLIVGLNTDSSVAELKGSSRPVNKLEHRAAVLSALWCVDYVIPFSTTTPYELIAALKPHVLVKGGDYSIESIVGAGLLQSYGGRVEIIPLVENLSTTNILNRLSDE
ncbi:MAG: D-glycero-beta-D-manno-heptose 1-phosphate adenylyltransferase [Muribaculaceae bacterium]